jgi:hypothetical protein
MQHFVSSGSQTPANWGKIKFQQHLFNRREARDEIFYSFHLFEEWENGPATRMRKDEFEALHWHGGNG